MHVCLCVYVRERETDRQRQKEKEYYACVHVKERYLHIYNTHMHAYMHAYMHSYEHTHIRTHMYNVYMQAWRIHMCRCMYKYECSQVIWRDPDTDIREYLDTYTTRSSTNKPCVNTNSNRHSYRHIDRHRHRLQHMSYSLSLRNFSGVGESHICINLY
jgi:hypothetical protein